MRRQLFVAVSLALLLGVCAASAFGQAAPTSGVRAEVLADLNYFEKRFVDLGERFSQEKYTWRPSEGVRSVSEVLLHVAGANFGLPRVIGVQPPAGFQPKGYDRSTTDKAKIVESLKQSFAHARGAVSGLSDADAEKATKFAGRESTYRGAMFYMGRHMAEHLGQLIAYARVNGIVPPWTEEAQKRQQQPPAAKKPQ